MSQAHPPAKPVHDEHGEPIEDGFGWRHRSGLIIAGLFLIGMFFGPPVFGLSPEGSKVSLLALMMATLWITEAIPIPATALLPLVMLPLLGILPMKQAAAPYADPIIYLFMGGFMLAIAMERWNLHRRIALNIIASVGTRPRAIIFGFLCAASFLSMWTSNSATAMMMLPIGVSVYALLKSQDGDTFDNRELGAALVLAIAYGANIGGIGTLIGTPPNAVLKAHLQNQHGIEIGFGQWMLIGVPLILVSLPLVQFILTRVSFRVGNREIPGVKEALTTQRKNLGRMSRAEWSVCAVFGLAIVLWISRELWKAPPPAVATDPWPLGALITDEVIAIGCALLLFLIPSGKGKGVFVLDQTCLKKLPWDVLVLFGGGLSLAAAMEKTGVIKGLAVAMQGMQGWPALAIVFICTAVMILATALTSNTATATAFLPVIAGLAIGINQPVILLAIPVAIAASADFALPVGTPPNAIAYGSGLITLPRMVRAGLWVDLLFAILIPLLMWTVGRWAFAEFMVTKAAS
jgi:sodium-dependent dicarboxylate transporter 2/3/5